MGKGGCRSSGGRGRRLEVDIYIHPRLAFFVAIAGSIDQRFRFNYVRPSLVADEFIQYVPSLCFRNGHTQDIIEISIGVVEQDIKTLPTWYVLMASDREIVILKDGRRIVVKRQGSLILKWVLIGSDNSLVLTGSVIHTLVRLINTSQIDGTILGTDDRINQCPCPWSGHIKGQIHHGVAGGHLQERTLILRELGLVGDVSSYPLINGHRKIGCR